MSLCECGCGLPAAIATRTNGRTKKGQSCRFKAGHKGRSRTATGYRKRQTPRGVIWEHIVVAETVLGKRLPLGAEVHHVDGTRRNNAPANLVICQSHAYHGLLHVRARVVRAGGNPNTDRICSRCHCVRPAFAFFANERRCRECKRSYDRERYARLRAH